MSKKGKVFFGLIALLLAGMVAWAIYTLPEPPKPIVDTDEPKIMSYDGNVISEEKNGVRIWDLTAEKMAVNLGNQDMEMTNLVGHFYQKDGRVLEIKSPKGTHKGDTRDIILEGGVTATTSDGYDLTCDKLTWKATEETLTAEGNAKINHNDKGMHAAANAIESSNGFHKFKATGKAHIEVEGKKK